MIKARKGEFELHDHGTYFAVVRPARQGEITNYVVCVGKEKYVRGKWNRIPADGIITYTNVYIPPACR